MSLFVKKLDHILPLLYKYFLSSSNSLLLLIRKLILLGLNQFLNPLFEDFFRLFNGHDFDLSHLAKAINEIVLG